MVFTDNVSELADLAARNPGSPAVVDPFYGDYGGTSSLDRLIAFSSCRPSTSLICYTRLTSIRQQRLAETDSTFAARLQPGLNDDYEALEAIILRCIDVQRVRGFLRRVEKVWCTEACRIFGHALDLAIGAALVPELAASLGVSTRTLNRHCRMFGSRSPKTILSLARVFTVERLAQWSRQPGGRVALALGFSDRANYRRLVRRTLGSPPTILRSRGGMDYVVESIAHALVRM